MSQLLSHPRLRLLFLPLLPPMDEAGDLLAGRDVLWAPDGAVDEELSGRRSRHLRHTRHFSRNRWERRRPPRRPVSRELDNTVISVLKMDETVEWRQGTLAGAPEPWCILVGEAREELGYAKQLVPYWRQHHYSLMDSTKTAFPRPPGPPVNGDVLRFVSWAFYFWSRDLVPFSRRPVAVARAGNALGAFFTCAEPGRVGALPLVEPCSEGWTETEGLREALIRLQIVHRKSDELVDAAVELFRNAALDCIPGPTRNAPASESEGLRPRAGRGDAAIGEYRLAISMAAEAFQPELPRRTLHAAVGLAAVELGIDTLKRDGYVPGESPPDDDESPVALVKRLDDSWRASICRIRKRLGWTGRIAPSSRHLVFGAADRNTSAGGEHA